MNIWIKNASKSKATPGAHRCAAQASRTSKVTFLSSSSLLQWIDADKLTGATFVFKLHHAVDQSKQRIVFAAAHVVAGLPLRAALAGDDVAAEHAFAAKLLQSQTLGLRVAAVAR